jgi:hypothetical protein
MQRLLRYMHNDKFNTGKVYFLKIDMYLPDLRVMVTTTCLVTIKYFILMPNQNVFVLTFMNCVTNIICQSAQRRK